MIFFGMALLCSPMSKKVDWTQDATRHSLALSRLSSRMQTALRRRRRGDLARALQSKVLHEIPIGAPSKSSAEQALQDLAREPVLIVNERSFGTRAENQAAEFVAAIERLCAAVVSVTSPHSPSRCAATDSTRRRHAENLRDTLLARLSRTTSGADAYNFLANLLGLTETGDFVIMPRQTRNFRKDDAPTVELRRSPRDGTFRARVRCVNNFAIHRFCDGYDVEECDASLVEGERSDSTTTPPGNCRRDGEDPAIESANRRHPEWLPIDTIVVDELVFAEADATVQSKRLLTIRLPNEWSRQIAF